MPTAGGNLPVSGGHAEGGRPVLAREMGEILRALRSASGINPVGERWIRFKIDITGGAQALREDRILDEARVTGGDIRRIIDMFDISVTAADRSTATLDNPALIAKTDDPHPHGPGTR